MGEVNRHVPALFTQEDKVVIIGHSGSGKTYLLDYLLKHPPISKFKPIFIVDTVNIFSYVPDMYYTGITRCKNPRKGQYCVKIHNDTQLEALIWYLSHTVPSFYLAVDEIDRYVAPRRILQETKLWLEEGRNFNRGGIFTVRRVAFLNKSILGNAHYLYLFKMLIKTDQEYIETITGIPVSDLQYHNVHSFYLIDLYKSKMIGEFMV